jgi:hypothetical protein
MILSITVILCVLSAMTTIVSFVGYIKARMAQRDDHSIAELDRKERLYRSIHFISLFIFVFLGVLILIQLSNRLQAVTD